MQPLCKSPVVLMLAVLLAAPLHAAESVSVRPLPAPETPHVLPWTAEAEGDWHRGDPAFVIEMEGEETSARGWFAHTDQAFLLRVEVNDAQHSNPHEGREIWRGDGVQIGIDALGDGSRGAGPHERGPFGADDMALGLALGDAGPQGWIFFRHSSAGSEGQLPAETFSVTRQDNITTYLLTLPWEMLSVQSGASPLVGLAVQLNDSTPGEAEQRRGYFGRGADGVPRPGMHERLGVQASARPVASLLPLNTDVWDAGTPARIHVSLQDEQPLRLTVRLGTAEESVVLEPGAGIHRVELLAHASADGQELEISATREDGSEVLAERVPLTLPRTVLFRLLDAVEARVESSPHPLFTRHLRSLQSLALSEWGRLHTYRAENPVLAGRTLQRLRDYTEAVQGDVGEWEAYLDGRRSLLFTLISPHDGTLQPYMVNLPRDWNPDQAYPLFFELHGAGDENPLNFPHARLSLTERAPDLHGYTTPKTYAEIQRNGYWVFPFGRGNLGYRGIAEIDIFEVYDEVHRLFRIDEDRRYLYGFSMGGGGTWANALRTPDRWAAVAILAGAPRGGIQSPMVPNLANLPVWIWCGEEDRLFPRTLEMVEALRAHNLEPVFSSTPNLGHSYIGEKQVESLNWLQTHTRRRPDSFRFYTDSDTLTSAWGIRLTRDPVLSGLPGFTVRIEGDTVHLDSEGTPSLTLDPGPQGLRLEGTDFTLIWNGEEVYRGPRVPLTLEGGQARNRR